MKRKLLLYMLSIAMSFALMSSNCGDDDDPPPPGEQKGTVTVTVINDVDNSPAANAKVRLYWTVDSMNTNRSVLSGDADAMGVKAFTNVPARTYYVKAEKGDAFASEQIAVEANKNNNITLRIKDVGHLRVNVKVSTEIGNPAGGAEVGVAWTADSAFKKQFIRPSVYTPSDGSDIGRVIISDLPRREYYVYAELAGKKGMKDVIIAKPSTTSPYTDVVVAVK